MYTNQHTPKTHRLSIRTNVGIIVLLLLVSGGAVFALNTKGIISVFGTQAIVEPVNAVPAAPAAVRPTNTVEYKPDPLSTQPPTAEKDPNPVQPPSSDAAAVTITRVNQTDGLLQVRALVSGATSGTCSVAMSQSDLVVNQANPITLQANQYGCGVLDIPLSKFSQSGSWLLVLTITDASGKSLAKAEESVQISL
jgi:hypothetical protein